MSWSASTGGKSAEEIFGALDDSFNRFYHDAHTSVRAQFETAKDVVDTLLGVVDSDYYACSMGGHSQEASPGSAADSISVLLSAVPEQKLMAA